MHHPPGCSVALLVPKEAETVRMFTGEGTVAEQRYGERVDEWIEDCRGMLEDAARRMRLPVDVIRYELFDESVPGHRRRQHIEAADVITTVDPSDTLLAHLFCSAMRKNPLLRMILAMSGKEELEDRFAILGQQKIEVLTQEGAETKIRAVPRVFAMVLDEDPRVTDTRTRKAVESALRFPHVHLIDPREPFRRN